jgi:hypothetical protein
MVINRVLDLICRVLLVPVLWKFCQNNSIFVETCILLFLFKTFKFILDDTSNYSPLVPIQEVSRTYFVSRYFIGRKDFRNFLAGKSFLRRGQAKVLLKLARYCINIESKRGFPLCILEFRTPLFPHLVPPAIMVWIFVWKYIFEPFIHISNLCLLLGIWCLTPLSTIFQLYYGPEYP